MITKTSAKVYAWSGYIFLALAIHCYLLIHHVSFATGLAWTIVVVLAFIGIDQFFFDLPPKITASIFTKKVLVTGSVMGGCILAAVGMLIRTHMRGSWPSVSALALVQSFIQGMLVGGLMRMLLTALFARMLRGAYITTQKNLLLFGLAILLWLLPWGEKQSPLTALYVLGVGFGFTLHYLVRSKEHARATRNRSAQHISSMLEEAAFHIPELNAIRYFANRNWKKLDQLLQNVDREWEKVDQLLQKVDREEMRRALAIIKASKQRLDGDYKEALKTLDKELETWKPGEGPFDNLLFLLKALNLGELPDKERDMFEALQLAMDAKSECLLTKLTYALRIAEKIPIEVVGDWRAESENKQRALSMMRSALALNESGTHSRILALVLGTTVPVTWTFLLDAAGYVLLKTGYYRFAKSLLTHCIYIDPMFSSPYLHLAEWYLIFSYMQSQEGSNTQAPKETTRLIKLCLHIAIQLEGKRDSLIKRRANEFLDNGNAAASQTVNAPTRRNP